MTSLLHSRFVFEVWAGQVIKHEKKQQAMGNGCADMNKKRKYGGFRAWGFWLE